MAVTVTTHLLDKQRFWRDKQGLHITDQWLVEELTGRPTEVLSKAMNAPGIPKYGWEHPETWILLVRKVQADFAKECTTKAIVSVEYGQLQPGDVPDFSGKYGPMTIQGDTSLQTVPTNYDRTGKEMRVYLAGKGKGQIATAQIQEALHTRRFTRVEKTDPSGKAELYGGTVNSKPFLGLGARRWFCAGIPFSSNDDGRTWTVTYIMAMRANAARWDSVLVALDPMTGKMHPDATRNVTALPDVKADVMAFRVYWEQDFNNLQIAPKPKKKTWGPPELGIF